MATYFTRGVESTNELRISLSRLNAFLTLPEPPVPAHLKVRPSASPVHLLSGRDAYFSPCSQPLSHPCRVTMEATARRLWL